MVCGGGTVCGNNRGFGGSVCGLMQKKLWNSLAGFPLWIKAEEQEAPTPFPVLWIIRTIKGYLQSVPSRGFHHVCQGEAVGRILRFHFLLYKDIRI